MSTFFYSDDKTTQIVLSLLKGHGIRKAVVSPGTTNIALVGSMQHDPFFQLYSAVDERSAAYMACGMAYESGEPVILSCTEATASRNYFPGLTEAYYRKLPVLAITGTHGTYEIGHLKPQVIDRTVSPADTVRKSVDLGACKDKNDEWSINVKVNDVILQLTRNGGGPAHINLAFTCNTYNTKSLPKVRIIRRFTLTDDLPAIPAGRIAVFVGSHRQWRHEEKEAVDLFCSNHNAVVFCDKTSGYDGKFRIDYALIAAQMSLESSNAKPDLLIHIGEVSGDTYTQGKLRSKLTWRVSEDGEVRDTFRNLQNVFAMSEKAFFTHYANENVYSSEEYLTSCKEEYKSIECQLPDIGFSNVWIANTLGEKIPTGSYLHFSIFNSLRSWNFIQLTQKIHTMCNVGGFGIDGALSTLLGASLVHPEILHFIVIGDLAFFYDMNALGNRHIGKNIRILLVNNGRGTEFRKLDHPCLVFGNDADPYMAAAGHYGCQSESLVKNFVINLGFEYLSASSKEEFLSECDKFVNPRFTESSVVFEVFTQSEDESAAIDAYRHVVKDNVLVLKNKAKSTIKAIGGKLKLK